MTQNGHSAESNCIMEMVIGLLGGAGERPSVRLSLYDNV